MSYDKHPPTPFPPREAEPSRLVTLPLTGWIRWVLLLAITRLRVAARLLVLPERWGRVGRAYRSNRRVCQRDGRTERGAHGRAAWTRKIPLTDRTAIVWVGVDVSDELLGSALLLHRLLLLLLLLVWLVVVVLFLVLLATAP